MANSLSTNKSALVTGGAGFIGSHLVEALVAAEYQVTVLDNLSSGYRENLDACQGDIDFIEGDIRDETTLARATADCEVIFHLAALVSVPCSFENPGESAAVNDTGTLKVLEAARQSNVRRVILSSSCAVYGNSEELPIAESSSVNPLSPYAVHKLAGEKYAADYSRMYDLETICLRYFNVYGPRQDPSSQYSGVISIFLERAIRGKRPIIHGDGRQSRDFIFVDEVVSANLLAARQNGISGSLFNIGTGCQTTINQLWEEVRSLTNTTLDPKYESARDGDLRTSLADTCLAEQKLGFKPMTHLAEGLAATYRWYKERLKAEV